MRFHYITTTILTALIAAVLAACGHRPEGAVAVDRQPSLRPEIAGATLPVNIAAPTFIIDEPAAEYFTEIGRCGQEPVITIGSTSSASVVPDPAKWKRLLSDSAGDEIYFRVTLTGEDGRVEQLADVVCPVSADSIDRYMAYRLLYPGYEFWSEVGIYQRDLESYAETPVIENSKIDKQCVNCHSFAGWSPATMMIHVRGKQGGTLLRRDGSTVKVNPRCPELANGATYPAWHPSGKYIAFSANEIHQAFHAKGSKTIEVYDKNADMTLYDVEADRAEAIAQLTGPEYIETFPSWAPDGRTLYFCRAQAYDGGVDIDSLRYDLCRIGFDPATREFAPEPEVVISAADEQKSVSFPRVSPDGRWLLYTLSDYGNFSIWHPESDLWLLDLAEGTTRPLDEVNSDDVESYHSWASNGRWMTFSSKRMDGLWARPYIAHFDAATGRFSAPFALPQADPLFYDDFMKTFNIPEFVTGPIDRTDEFVADVASAPR